MSTKNELKNRPQVINLSGLVFSRLVVKEFVGIRGKGASWKCVCECGNETIVSSNSLRRGTTRSCGCLALEAKTKNVRKMREANTRHGETHSYLYQTWWSMRQRCSNPNVRNYPRYGGRGITTHPVFDVYEGFRDYVLTSLGHRKPRESLDRIDNNGNYEPGNLRWATPPQQQRNRGDNRMVELFGEELCLTEAIEKWGVADYGTIQARVYKLGWPIEKAILTPPRKLTAKPT